MIFSKLEDSFFEDFAYDVRDQLKRFIYNRSEKAFSAGDAARDAIKNPDELYARNLYMREKFIECIGGLPSVDSPLNPIVVGSIECSGYRIEKVIFESRPKVYITANLYIPNGIKSPQGAVLVVCGHTDDGKQSPDHQLICQYLVKSGLIVMAQDPVGQGERFGYYEKSINTNTMCYSVVEHDYVGSQCWPLGDGLARYFIHDAMRGIDYLCTRPEVDPGRIGVTGYSGGGLQTSMLMVCDPRIAAAAPAAFVMNRQTYIYANMSMDSEQIWPGMSKSGFDHEDILMAMVPRPVLVLAVTSDFFPIEGTRRTVDRTKRFWEMYGKKDCIQLFEDNCEHSYTPLMIKAAAEFFTHHLLGEKITPGDEGIKPIEEDKLWCTKTGQIRKEFDNARFIFDENLERLKEIEKERDSISEEGRKEKSLEWLKERVFNNRKPVNSNPRRFNPRQVVEFTVEGSIWWSQEGIFNHGLIFRDCRFSGEDLPVTVAVWDNGTRQIQSHSKWIRETCSSGRNVVILDVSGVGKILPYVSDFTSGPYDFLGLNEKLTHDLMWLDDSMAAMRTYDVIRAIDAIESFKGVYKEDIRLYAYGRQGLYALLAAAIDERVKGIKIVDGMDSISEWVGSRYYDHYDISSIIIPGMLKYFDLPDLKRWISGRSL